MALVNLHTFNEISLNKKAYSNSGRFSRKSREIMANEAINSLDCVRLCFSFEMFGVCMRAEHLTHKSFEAFGVLSAIFYLLVKF